MEATIRFKGEEHRVTRDDIVRVTRSVTPEKITTYYVEVEGKKFPPKQLLRAATGTRSSFNSANARSLLTKLGFAIHALPH